MSASFSEKDKGIIALIILSFIYALFGIFSRFLNTEFPIFQQVYLRSGAAFFLSFVIFRGYKSFHKLKKISFREWILILVRSLFWYGIGTPLFTLGIILAKYGNASFIASIPSTAILSLLILREKLTKEKCTILLLSLLGVGLISVKNLSDIFAWGKGEFLVLLCAFIVSFAIIARKWHSKVLNNQEITQFMFFFGTVFLFILSLIFGEGFPRAHWNMLIIAAILVSAVLNVIMLFLVNYALERVKGVLSGNILVLESLWGVLIGFLLYHEILSLKEFIGGALIIASVFKMNVIDSKEK